MFTETVLPSILNTLSNGVYIPTIDKHGYPPRHGLLELDKESLDKILQKGEIVYSTYCIQDRQQRLFAKKQARVLSSYGRVLVVVTVVEDSVLENTGA